VLNLLLSQGLCFVVLSLFLKVGAFALEHNLSAANQKALTNTLKDLVMQCDIRNITTCVFIDTFSDQGFKTEKAAEIIFTSLLASLKDAKGTIEKVSCMEWSLSHHKDAILHVCECIGNTCVITA